MDHVAKLAEALASQQATIVVGSGCSVSISDGAERASWPGLLKSGIQYLEENDSTFTSGHKDHISRGLDLALTDDDTDLLVVTASDIQTRILKIGEVAFAKWLETSVGSIPIKNANWGEAILALGCPVLTTNYDTLLEQVGERGTATWQDGRAMQQAVFGDGIIGHLHGAWDSPKSVILSGADYQRHRDSEQIQSIQKALLTLRSLVFVGYGSGMQDPNFADILSWHRNVFPNTPIKHYRLCRDAELESLRLEHAKDNIIPISYGADFSDLPDFLASIQPSPVDIATRPTGQREAIAEGKERFLDSVREQALLVERNRDRSSSSLNELIHPPVLLSVPYAEFLRTKREGTEGTGRIDPHMEASDGGVLIVVGDENAGLTTTLKWLIWTATCDKTDTAPVYVDFPTFPSGVGPLKNRLVKEALNQGLIARKADPLPPVVVAVDNFSPYSNKSHRAVEDIAATPTNLLIIGCRSGDENALSDLLQERGIEHRVRYLGRLALHDIRAMAQLIVPERSEQIATSVMNLLASEHLPRTPITVAMLISILCQGGQVALNASPTAIINQFVDLLLGRGESGDDTRLGVGSANRESILADLAGLFAERREASVTESAAITRMEQLFERFAWRESPTEVLRELVNRRLLRVHQQRVSFTQSSYLHLFAAKQAVKKQEAKSRLINDPAYFAPVLKAYAALAQWDDAPLKTVELLLESFEDIKFSGTAFAIAEQQDVPDDLLEQLSSEPPKEALPQPQENEPEPPTDHFFDNLADMDIVPFSSAEDLDLPVGIRLMRTVDLASTILRDGEEVEDLALKTRVLMKTLSGWGKLIDAFGDDPHFADVVAFIVETEAPKIAADGVPLEDVKEVLTRIFPALIVAGGITTMLSSRKLSLILGRLFQSGEVVSNEHAAFAAAILAIDLADDDWVNQVAALVDTHGHRVVFGEFIGMLLQVAYEKMTPSTTEEALLGVLVKLSIFEFRFKTEPEKKRVMAAMRQKIARDKAQHLQMNKRSETKQLR